MRTTYIHYRGKLLRCIHVCSVGMLFQSFCILTLSGKSSRRHISSILLVFLRPDLYERAMRWYKKELLGPGNIKSQLLLTDNSTLGILLCFLLKFRSTFPSSLLFTMTCSAAAEKLKNSEAGKRTKPQECKGKEKSVFLRDGRNY